MNEQGIGGVTNDRGQLLLEDNRAGQLGLLDKGTKGVEPPKTTAKPNQGQGFSSKGHNPAPGERTFEGYLRNNVSPDAELKLRTNSPGFNNNAKGTGGDFKRFGNGSHGGLDPHVHQPKRNFNPKTGDVYGGTYEGKIGEGKIYPLNTKDIKQLYNHIENGKYY